VKRLKMPILHYGCLGYASIKVMALTSTGFHSKLLDAAQAGNSGWKGAQGEPKDIFF